MPLIQVSDIFYLTVCFKFLNFNLQIFFFLFLKCLPASRLTLFRVSILLWFGSCNHFVLAYFLWTKIRKHSSSNHVLFCFNSYRLRLLLAEVLLRTLLLSQTLFMSSLSCKFSKTTNMSETWYCSLTSSSFSFLRLNLSTSNFRAATLLTASLSLILQPPDSDQHNSQLP